MNTTTAQQSGPSDMNPAAPDPSAATFVDEFRGDTEHLVGCIKALIELSDAKALAPHGLGGHARSLLSAAVVRLSAPAAAVGGDQIDWLERSLRTRFSDFPIAHQDAESCAESLYWCIGDYLETKRHAAPVGGFVVDRDAVVRQFQDAMERKHGYRPTLWDNGDPINGRDYDRLEGFKLALAASPAAQSSPHTTEDDYQHFLSYSGLEHSPLLQYAYYHGADVGLEKPKDAAQSSAKDRIEFPECSGTPNDCPENEGHGCCKAPPPKYERHPTHEWLEDGDEQP